MKNQTNFIVVLLILIILLTACSSSSVNTSTQSPSSTTNLDGAALLQERCTACHPLSRVESSRFSAAEWKTVVDTMISRGAQLTPEEETIVVNYLAANFGQ